MNTQLNIMTMDARAILKQVATNKHVQQTTVLSKEDIKSSMGSSHPLPNGSTLTKEGTRTLDRVATKKHLHQLGALTQDEMFSQTVSANPLVKSVSKSSHKQKHCFHKNKRILKAALAKVTAKVNQLSKLEATAYKDIKKPIFSSTELQHPLNFLEDLKDYFSKLPTEHQTLDAIMECLQGPAYHWALTIKDKWTDIEHFKRDFIEQYWGMSSQSALRREIISGSYSDEEGSMSRYFIHITSQARWLLHKMTDDELVSNIMHHFPRQVQIAWYLSGKRTCIDAVEFLRKMDEIDVLCALNTGTQRECQKSKYKLTCENAADNIHSRDQDLGQSDSKRIKLEL